MRVGMRYVVQAATIFCTLPFPAYADIWSPPAGLGEPLAGDIAELKKKPAALFYSDCSIGDGKKALMIFPAASHEGRFYLIGYRPMDKVASIAGYGRVSVGDGRLEILNTSKAMQDTLPKIAGALMAGKFQFLASSKVDEIVHNRPAAHCTGEPNTTP